jgi:glutamine synthetase
VQKLPRTLGEAVEAFEADSWFRDCTGQRTRRRFIRYKSAEWEEYHNTISQWKLIVTHDSSDTFFTAEDAKGAEVLEKGE